jgi:NTP pyrophosphatase (non-canonical NTP hydrolase)
MTLDQLRERYRNFVRKRNWGKYHTPQNLAHAISVESNELLENFLWMDNPSSNKVKQDEELLDEINDEMADVMIYLIGLANQLDVDLLAIVEEKMAKNEQRFDEAETDEINEYLDQWQ